MLNKKGMSPLLMTIILIALAVALGAMIMSWGSNKTSGDKGSCEDVNLVVQQAFNTDLVCFNQETSKLKMVVKNSGKTSIKSLIYRRINPDMSIRDTVLPASEMTPGKIYEAEIPYIPGAKVHIEIIPQLMVENELILCDKNAIIKENVPDCPK
ncbi:MAG: hypothetical protein ACP5N3_04590 [Candidatus Nanoarchaeia archaeon]